MTKSAVKAYGKVYLIFYINIPKPDNHLYRHTLTLSPHIAVL